MFETAELGRTLSREDYKPAAEKLRAELLEAQSALLTADFPVVILINGVDGGGKGDVLNLLCEWMDGRFVTTEAYAPPTEEERERPEFWRFWMWVPPRGRVGIFLGSWYTEPILRHGYGKTSEQEFDAELERANDFERALSADGALVIKLWMHVSRAQQKRHFKKLEANKLTRWRVTKQDWEHHKLYDHLVRVCSRALRQTSTGEAAWTIIESADENFRNISAGTHVLDRIRERLARAKPEKEAPPAPTAANPSTIFDSLDLKQKLERTQYTNELNQLESRLNRLSRKLEAKKRSVIVVFEGMDAAGKGGAIRRITRALDARSYRVIPIAAPTDEERAHHYLWRFWRHIPRRGRFTIYDRSWYGRVLVERVEGFAREAEWRRAYKEINDFEEQLTEHGTIVLKFWLHISAEEQLKRFEERKLTPYKQYKITSEDYRNRNKANPYELASAEMVERTSTEYCPWTLVEANDKLFARIKVLSTLCERLEAELNG